MGRFSYALKSNILHENMLTRFSPNGHMVEQILCFALAKASTPRRKEAEQIKKSCDEPVFCSLSMSNRTYFVSVEAWRYRVS